MIDLADYVVDPEGKPVLLGAAAAGAGDALGEARATGPAQITYTPGKTGAGNGTITFEAMDGATLQDSPNVVLLSLPVTVLPGANTAPVVRDGRTQRGRGRAGLDPRSRRARHRRPRRHGFLLRRRRRRPGHRRPAGRVGAARLPRAPMCRVARPRASASPSPMQRASRRRAPSRSRSRAAPARWRSSPTKRVDEATAGEPVTISVADQTAYNPFPDVPLKVVSASAVPAGGARVTLRRRLGHDHPRGRLPRRGLGALPGR